MIQRFFILLCTLAVLVGCTNKYAKLGTPQHMPENWLTIKPNAWQVRELPESYRTELAELRTKLERERDGQYYSFHGTFNPKVQNEIDTTIEQLNQAYLDLKYTSKAILASLTPGLDGLAETYSEREAGIAVTNNANRRLLKDDVNRALMLDKSSALSPYPTIND